MAAAAISSLGTVRSRPPQRPLPHDSELIATVAVGLGVAFVTAALHQIADRRRLGAADLSAAEQKKGRALCASTSGDRASRYRLTKTSVRSPSLEVIFPSPTCAGIVPPPCVAAKRRVSDAPSRVYEPDSVVVPTDVCVAFS